MSALVFHEERCPANPKLRAFVEWWKRNGPFAITIAYGRRTDAEQAALYAQGRTKPGKIVTNAKSARESAHGRDGAIDCYPVRESHGHLVTLIYLGDEADPEVRAVALHRLERYCELVRKNGLVSGEDFVGLKDRPHAEDPKWRDLPFPPPN